MLAHGVNVRIIEGRMVKVGPSASAMFAVGTEQTLMPMLSMFALRGKADMASPHPECPLMTLS